MFVFRSSLTPRYYNRLRVSPIMLIMLSCNFVEIVIAKRILFRYCIDFYNYLAFNRFITIIQ